jgi:hypothetical protein
MSENEVNMESMIPHFVTVTPFDVTRPWTGRTHPDREQLGWFAECPQTVSAKGSPRLWRQVIGWVEEGLVSLAWGA